MSEGGAVRTCMILIFNYLHSGQSEIFRIKAQSCSNCSIPERCFFSHNKMYDRNRRKNWRKMGRDTDFSSHQSEDYFSIPVFETFVVFDTAVFENLPVLPGVCLTQNTWKTVLAAHRLWSTPLTTEAVLSPWNAAWTCSCSGWMTNKLSKRIMMPFLLSLPFYEILAKQITKIIHF